LTRPNRSGCASHRYGFDATHEGVLEQAEAARLLNTILAGAVTSSGK